MPKKRRFTSLALGARFALKLDGSEWVKVDNNRIASWNPSLVAENWTAQRVRSATDGDPAELWVYLTEVGAS